MKPDTERKIPHDLTFVLESKKIELLETESTAVVTSVPQKLRSEGNREVLINGYKIPDMQDE